MTLKVLGYNICLGGEDRLAAIAAVIRAQRPDAVALLEATDRATAATLARDLAMHLTFGDANNGIHVAWLSHPPVRRWANHRQLALAKTLLEIEVAWAGARVGAVAAPRLRVRLAGDGDAPGRVRPGHGGGDHAGVGPPPDLGRVPRSGRLVSAMSWGPRQRDRSRPLGSQDR